MRFLWFLFLFGCCVVELTFRVSKSSLLINLSDFNHFIGESCFLTAKSLSVKMIKSQQIKNLLLIILWAEFTLMGEVYLVMNINIGRFGGFIEFFYNNYEKKNVELFCGTKYDPAPSLEKVNENSGMTTPSEAHE